MKKVIGFFVLVMLGIYLISGCAKNNPTSPATSTPNLTATSQVQQTQTASIWTHTNTPTQTFTPTYTATQTGLFVEQAVIVQAQTSHGVGSAVASFVLRYGNASGAYVQGATITMGGATLTESTPGHYGTTAANVADASTINLSISSLAGNASSSLIVPYDGAITTPASSGGNQSAATQMLVCQQFCLTTCPMPQIVRLYVWRGSDQTVYVNQLFTPPTAGNNYNSQCWNINANVLPNMGQIYVRAYAINQAAIIGANGGSVTFQFENSENTYYVNMQP